MTRISRILRNLTSLKSKARKPIRTRLGVESLERRDVPAIFLSGNVLVAKGDAAHDTITVSINDNGTATTADDTVVASRIAITNSPLGKLVFTETKSFAKNKVLAIQSSLGGGDNSFENNTDLKCVVFGGAGKDEISGGGFGDVLHGNGGDDTIRGFAGDDTIYAGAGNDQIAGGLGKDTIYGDSGNDLIYGNSMYSSLGAADSSNILRGGAGNDTIQGAAGYDFILGEDGNDVLKGGTANDTLNGGAGNDTLHGNDGNDSLLGGAGADCLNGDDGNDTLEGGLNGDSLCGGDGDDSLRGGDGWDRLHGGAGKDFLHGEAGKDYLIGASGSDLMYGGSGVDVLVALDNEADIFFGANGIVNGERDELWIDGSDALLNPTVVAMARDLDKRSVHTVTDYRNYLVNGLPVSPTLNYGVSDLPDPVAQGDDGSPAKQDFADHPLFSYAGPQYTDIDQGSVGSCYFLAKLAAMAKTQSQYIRDMIADLGDGTYAVQFFNQQGERRFVRVDADLYVNGSGKPVYADLGNEGSLWVALIEKAWAIHRHGNAAYEEINGGNSAVTDTGIALGLNHGSYPSSAYLVPLAYVAAIREKVLRGFAVTLGGPAGMTDDTPMTDETFSRAQHIYMVHSVDVGANGVPTKVMLYNLYGGGLTEITDFTMLKFCSSGFSTWWVKS